MYSGRWYFAEQLHVSALYIGHTCTYVFYVYKNIVVFLTIEHLLLILGIQM